MKSFFASCLRPALALLLALPVCALAVDLDLPAEIGATAQVDRSERDGLWEKTLVVRFAGERRALSTSDGPLTARAALNQAAHPLLWRKLGADGKRYSEERRTATAARLQLPPAAVAEMSTAADMDNLAVVTRRHGPLTVTVLATAGAKSNAIRTGVDAGAYIEGEEPAGTINIMVLANIELSDAALARALITITEGKTAALEDLKVPSSYTRDVQATGTGTDSIIVVSGTAAPRATYTGGHSRIGELIGKATYAAVVEALGKQNGYFLPGSKRYGDAAAGPAKAAGDLRLALLHLDPVPGDIVGNRARIEDGIRAAVRHSADWVVTPELAETGYNFAKRVGTDWIAPFPDAWISTLAAIARDNGVALFVGFAERDAQTGKLHNSVAAIAAPGRPGRSLVPGRQRRHAFHGRWHRRRHADLCRCLAPRRGRPARSARRANSALAGQLAAGRRHGAGRCLGKTLARNRLAADRRQSRRQRAGTRFLAGAERRLVQGQAPAQLYRRRGRHLLRGLESPSALPGRSHRLTPRFKPS
jgi:adenosylcobinamide amidohydrolase